MTARRLAIAVGVCWSLGASLQLSTSVSADEACAELTPTSAERVEASRERPATARPTVVRPTILGMTASPAPVSVDEPLRLPCIAISPQEAAPERSLTAETRRDLERCRAGSQLHCFSLQATLHEKNPVIATEAAQLACDGGAQRSCAVLGRRLAIGLGVEADFDAGVAVMRDACANDPMACFELTLMLRGTRPDEAFEAARRGCASGRAIQCEQAGDLALEGAGGATPAEAAAWYDSACERGSHDGCVALLRLSESGRLGPVDASVLVQRRKRACAVGLRTACGPR